VTVGRSPGGCRRQDDMTFGDESGRTFIVCNACATWTDSDTCRPDDLAIAADGRLTVAIDGNGWGNLGVLKFAPDGRTDAASPRWMTDRFYDVAGRNATVSWCVDSRATPEGDYLAVVAGSTHTTVLRLKGTDVPVRVSSLAGNFTQQSESDSRACRCVAVAAWRAR